MNQVELADVYNYKSMQSDKCRLVILFDMLAERVSTTSFRGWF